MSRGLYGRNIICSMRRFRDAREGAAAMIFGLLIIPLMLALGAAVDYGRAGQTRTTLQTAVDSAAIAAASAMLKGGNPAQAATNYVQQRFTPSGRTVTTTTTTDANQGTVTVRATTLVPTSVMKLARIETMPVTTTATASIGAGGNQKVEMAIVFDTTGSMSQGGRLATA